MTCLSVSISLMKWGYESSTRSKENTRFDMKTWYLITMQSSKWPIHLMAFMSIMYLVSKTLRQILWLHWQLRWPYPLTQLIILRWSLDVSPARSMRWKLMKSMQYQHASSLETSSLPLLTMPCMIYYQTTLSTWLLSGEGLSAFNMIQ